MPLTPVSSRQRQEEDQSPPSPSHNTAPPQLPLTGLPGNLADLIRRSAPDLRLHGTMLETTLLRDLLDHNQAQPLCEIWCNAQEQRQLQAFSLPKRRREWLAGRICAKQAIQKYLQEEPAGTPMPTDFTNLLIIPAESGRPVLKAQPAISTPPLISISHSGNFAAALAASIPCGIDIQEIRPSLAKIRPQFCSEEEYGQLTDRLPDRTALEQLALLWAGKEAIRKAAPSPSMPGFLAMYLLDIIPSPTHGSSFFTFKLRPSRPVFSAASSQIIQVAAHLIDGYATAVCVIPAPKNSGGTDA